VTLAAEQWPAYTEPAAARAGAPAGAAAPAGGRPGTLTVWRLELAKLRGQWRVRAIALMCLAGPFIIVAGLNVQTATPGDTAFGQWVHASGFAIPMVILGFGGQWLLPVGTAVVAGDIFSSEDHFGTWKTILTRSRSRGELFAGKFLAALTFAVAAVILLTITGLLAGLLAGTQPVVGLGGQLVPAGQATELVLVSWLSVLPPVLGFTALAIFTSVASRNSVAGIGVPVVLTLAFQVVTLVALPAWGQQALLSTPFLAWHGFWEQPAYVGPFMYGLITSAVWFTLCSAAAWLVFRRRTIGGAS
jgi:ABC-2 type transport system permease protein